MKKITEKEIARQLAELINENVKKIENEDQRFKNQYDAVLEELESEIKRTEEVIIDYTEASLPINKVEQEGYLRCLRTMVNRFRDWERRS